ncbi:predicted protein [Histoplasma capsulatum H143]|uniref:Uncharacterized protein n=1 Tax=Ajellomyces capsulatus (strain H143) TaxID=544712 RepID=C6H5T7_AJECH|nr:predicted protein [Histoplasma capsulatum H143]
MAAERLKNLRFPVKPPPINSHGTIAWENGQQLARQDTMILVALVVRPANPALEASENICNLQGHVESILPVSKQQRPAARTKRATLSNHMATESILCDQAPPVEFLASISSKLSSKLSARQWLSCDHDRQANEMVAPFTFLLVILLAYLVEPHDCHNSGSDPHRRRRGNGKKRICKNLGNLTTVASEESAKLVWRSNEMAENDCQRIDAFLRKPIRVESHASTMETADFQEMAFLAALNGFSVSETA